MAYLYTVNAGDNLSSRVVEFTLSKVDISTNPLALSDVNIWVPSPRAELALKDAFREACGQALLLPQIKTLSISDEEADIFRFDTEKELDEEIVNGVSRLMVMTHLVRRYKPELTFSAALMSAEALVNIFSKLETYSITLNDVTNEVPLELSSHWKSNLEFLEIALNFYPEWLKLTNKVDATQAAKSRMLRQAEFYTENEPEALTIIAGVSDTTPAGLSLIKAVLGHDNGAIFFPALDLKIVDIPNIQHPQYTMHKMLSAVDLTVSDISTFGDESLTPREALIRKAFGEYSSEEFSEDQSLKALNGVRIIDAEDAMLEAESIALLMRQNLEEAGKTCALVSPDRNLAVRVESFLKRWNVDVDDSAGVSLLSTPLGALFIHTADVIRTRFSPLPLAEFLHHPLSGIAEKQAILGLERLVLRGKKPRGGIGGLKKKLAQTVREEGQFINNIEILAPLAEQAISDISTIFEPLMPKKIVVTETTDKPKDAIAFTAEKRSVAEWIKKHTQVLTSALSDDSILQDESAKALAGLLENWQQTTKELGVITLDTYLDILKRLMQKAVVRKRYGTHPRLSIWGPMEARMQRADHVIIAGLNEGTWPRSGSIDPWLNAGVSSALGLPEKDVHVGMSAHDFLHLFCQGEVTLTRAKKDAEGDMVASRFFARLEATVPETVWAESIRHGEFFTSRAKALRSQSRVCELPDNAAKILLEKRPKAWSASTVRDLMQCPYKVFVSKVLGLQKLDGFEEMPSAADKGDLIHRCLEAFFVAIPSLPKPFEGDYKDAAATEAHLLTIGDHVFKWVDEEGVKALWQQRFKVIAKGFAEQLATHTAEGRKAELIEAEGKYQITKHVMLKARADRMDVDANGDYIILDYKTGTPPTFTDVAKGKEPQLLVESIILKNAGFTGKPETVADIEYWRVHGTKGEGIQLKAGKSSKIDIPEALEQAEEGVQNLAEYFSSESAEFLARPGGATALDKEGACTYCDYAGICRYSQWQGHPNLVNKKEASA
jgi:ATP-dependent helicase/nuclease subunit B